MMLPFIKHWVIPFNIIIKFIDAYHIIFLVSSDYGTQTEVLTFSTGTTAVYSAFDIVDDMTNEDLEQFTAELSSPSPGLSLLSSFVATVDIFDDDGERLGNTFPVVFVVVV